MYYGYMECKALEYCLMMPEMNEGMSEGRPVVIITRDL